MRTKKISKALGFASLIIGFILIVYFECSFFSHYTKAVLENQNFNRHHIQCTDILSQLTSGYWHQRRDISSFDLAERRRLDLQIRRNRLLPLKLTSNDSRCGTKYPLTDPGFGYQLPALCDASSNTPCCNDVTGKCGGDLSHCTCPECIDYRNVYNAELCNWKSLSGCKMKTFTSREACEFMNSRVSSLVLIGDSLMRHFHNALMILFTNNPQGGALRKGIAENERKACSGEMQFVDAGKTVCHGKISRQISDVEKNSFCRGNFKFDYSFNESYCIEYAQGAIAVVEEHLNKKNAVIVIGVGLHDGLNFDKITQDYVEPILRLVENRGTSGWPRIVWVTTHAHGSLKPIAFRGAQGNDKVMEFNRRMKGYLEPRGVDVFDVFNLTLGLHSYDGTHYGIGVNMMKAQLLLNYLMETVQLLHS